MFSNFTYRSKSYSIFLVGLFALFCNSAFAQPSAISGLSLWLKSDFGVTADINNKVTSWLDASGNNNHCIQTDTSMAPSLNANIVNLNNQSSVLFDGVNDFIPFTTRITNIRTVFFLIKHLPSASNFEPILGDNTGTDFQGDDYPVTNRIFHFSDASPSILNGGIRINQLNISPVVLSIRPSNYSIVTLTTTANVAASQITRDRSIGSRVWKGEYSEIIIYDHALTPSEVNVVETYLINKYAPTLNLGPDIAVAQNPGCVPTTSVTIQADPNFNSYLWSTGSTSDQISVNQYGEYSVITTDIFGIQHHDTVKVAPPPKPFNYPGQILCKNDTIKWNTLLDKTVHTFQWQDFSTDSLFVIPGPGQYYVNITDTFGCVYNSNTVTIIQDDFIDNISLGPDVNLCAGNPIYLKQGLSSNLTYTWNTGSNNDSLYITNTSQYSVIITNTNNCVAKDTINVTVIGQAPTASFLNSIACKSNSVSFNDNSSPPSGNSILSWFWNYGDATTLGDTSHLQNPFYTFADTGNFNVNLTVTTNVGCKQTIAKNIHVAPKPVVNFNNIIACKNDSALFTNSITTFGYPTNNYSWNFGDPTSGLNNASSLPSPKHFFSQQLTYSVTLAATNSAGCIDSITKPITVKAQVTASFTNTIPCTNSPIVFQDNSIVPPPNNLNTRIWNFGSGPINALTVTKSFTNTGAYSVTLTVNGSNGCVSSITKLINVMLPPIPGFTLPAICLTDTSTAVDQSIPQNGSISAWNWQLNNSALTTTQTLTLSPLSAATYTVKLVVTNSFGCKDSVNHPLTVFPLPNVDFSTNPSTYNYINLPVTFIPSITNGSLYNWNINGSPFSIQSPTVNFASVGTYSVSLYMEDSQGCGNSKAKSFTVLNRLLDLAILDVRSTKSADNYFSVDVDLANFGTIPISTFDISYQITNAGSIKETWNGTINPSGFLTYKFIAKTLSKNNEVSNITCVNIETVNAISDENLSNNKQCAAENSNNIVVSDPYPSPTDGDILLPIILNKDQEYTMELFNSLGQMMIEEITKNGVAGLNLVSISTSSYNRGTYLLKITINDKIFIKKFIKR